MDQYLVENLFGIDGLNIAWYGVWVAVGVLLALWCVTAYAQEKKVSQELSDFVFYDLVASIVAGIFFAAVFQGLYTYIDNPAGGFHLNTGLTFIGGLIGGMGFFILDWFLYRKKLPEPIFHLVPVIPCAVALGHAFGRVGCFFAGCCYGKPTDSILGVQFPDLSCPVHPTQLYEALFLLVLFALMSWLLLKKNFIHTVSMYGICYGIYRFCIEFIRDDYRGEFVGGLTPSQFWSLTFVLAGAALIPVMKKTAAKLQAQEVQRAAAEAEPETAETDSPEAQQETDLAEELQPAGPEQTEPKPQETTGKEPAAEPEVVPETEPAAVPEATTADQTEES